MADRTDEERIIETMVIEGNTNPYDDSDFVPIRQSLYTVATVIPEYDDEIFHRIVWRRPNAITTNAEYFDPNISYNSICCEQGTLPDDTFLGALTATCVYPGRDLIENIFASRPEDFKQYGIYTCRFYVEGEWVDVLTDTCLPCVRDDLTGECTLAYGRSGNPKELWISLAEKAYAKAVGSFEAIEKVKPHEALLHLTGGSVQQMHLQDESNKDFQVAGGVFKFLCKHFQSDTMILLMPNEVRATGDNGSVSGGGAGAGAGAGAHHGTASVGPAATIGSSASVTTNADDSTIDERKEEKAALAAEMETYESLRPENMFHSGKLYSVIACRDVGGFEMLLLHSPWNQGKHWRGGWSDKSTDWDLYPEMQQEFDEDPTIPWTRHRPNGYFWMTAKNVAKYFNLVYLCKLFPNDKFNYYCVTGDWRGKSAGGAMTTVRDRATVAKEAAASKVHSIQRATAAVVVDGDPSWFNNPQFRVQATKKTTLYVSVLASNGLESDGIHVLSATVTSMPKSTSSSRHPHLWDASTVEVVASLKQEGRAKGQEASLWSLEVDAHHYYHIVVHTFKRGLEGSFILRLFASEHITVEKIANLDINIVDGSWTKHGDLDSTGGPPKAKSEESGALKENGKWCQNPQFHLEVVDPYGREEVYLKVVVRRTDKGAHQAAHHKGVAAAGATAGGEAKAADVTVGMVIMKAELLEDNAAARKKNQPRQNAVGELIVSKETTLKRRVTTEEDMVRDLGGRAVTRREEGKKTVLRKTAIDPHVYFQESTYNSRTDCCIFYPKIPRSWMPNGLIIIPSLSEKGVRGNFEVEAFCSEPVILSQLPDTYSRSIAGAWAEGAAGGSHLCNTTWKKNPKFLVTFKQTSRDVSAPCRVRITLSRGSANWKTQRRKDPLGSMIGFYIFISRDGNELNQIYESTFVPTDELSTEPSFMLAPLPADEEYVIMPATYGESQLGPFVLTIMSEHEFSFKKEK